MRASRIRYAGKVESHGNVESLLKNPGDVVLVERGRPRSIVILCPCGCGDEIIVNIDSRVGPAWCLFNKKGLTLYPSVWRESGCKSHFIVWNERIYWCGYDSLWDESYDESNIEEPLLELLKQKEFLHYEDMKESQIYI